MNRSQRPFTIQLILQGLLVLAACAGPCALAQSADELKSYVAKNLDAILAPDSSVAQLVSEQNTNLAEQARWQMKLDMTSAALLRLAQVDLQSYEQQILAVEKRIIEDAQDAYLVLEATQNKWLGTYGNDYHRCYPHINELDMASAGILSGYGLLALQELGTGSAQKFLGLDRRVALGFRLASYAYPWVGGALGATAGAEFVKPDECNGLTIPPSPAHLTSIAHQDLSLDLEHENEIYKKTMKLYTEGALVAAATGGVELYRLAQSLLSKTKQGLNVAQATSKRSFQLHLLVGSAVLMAADPAIDAGIEHFQEKNLRSELAKRQRIYSSSLEHPLDSDQVRYQMGQKMIKSLRLLTGLYLEEVKQNLKATNQHFERMRKEHCASGAEMTPEWESKLSEWHSQLKNYVFNSLHQGSRSCYMSYMKHEIYSAIGHFGLKDPRTKEVAQNMGPWGPRFLERLHYKHADGLKTSDQKHYLAEKNTLYASWADQFANHQFCDDPVVLLLQAESYLSEVAPHHPLMDAFVVDTQNLRRFLELLSQQVRKEHRFECWQEEVPGQ